MSFVDEMFVMRNIFSRPY